eukprot:jgi/Bigna1/87259/estExt_fgenesh1_pg.C_180112
MCCLCRVSMKHRTLKSKRFTSFAKRVNVADESVTPKMEGRASKFPQLPGILPTAVDEEDCKEDKCPAFSTNASCYVKTAVSYGPEKGGVAPEVRNLWACTSLLHEKLHGLKIVLERGCIEGSPPCDVPVIWIGTDRFHQTAHNAMMMATDSANAKDGSLAFAVHCIHPCITIFDDLSSTSMKCSHGVSIPCPLMLAFTSSTKHLTIFGRLSWTAHSSGGKPRMSTPSRLAPACSTTSHDVDVAAQSCYTKRGPVLFWRGGHAHIRSRVDSFRRVKDLENNLSDELPKQEDAESSASSTSEGAAALEIISEGKPLTGEFGNGSHNLEPVATFREAHVIEFPAEINDGEDRGTAAGDHRAQKLVREGIQAEDFLKQLGDSHEHCDTCEGNDGAQEIDTVETQTNSKDAGEDVEQKGNVGDSSGLDLDADGGAKENIDEHSDACEGNDGAQEIDAVEIQTNSKDAGEDVEQKGNVGDSSGLDLDAGGDNGGAKESIDKGQSQRPSVGEDQADESATSSKYDGSIDYDNKCLARDIEMIDAALRILDE